MGLGFRVLEASGLGFYKGSRRAKRGMIRVLYGLYKEPYLGKTRY